MNVLAVLTCVALEGFSLLGQTTFPDTDKVKQTSDPRKLASQFEVPRGFNVSLFAAEPEVVQPIGMTFDEKGRLWVAECLTYAESGINFDTTLSDRIVVLQDSDHDGQMDRRTVFWDAAKKLTSVEVGFGGVWALCPPQLLFIPDANGDLIPDGKPVVVLDGWNDKEVRHNIANGLRWGPDGWLYGRHGILATSNVGRPGASENERQKINCGVWRYHPTEQRFETVSHGTTNPWGMDFDEHGELFFINTVIGHLWHSIPGAHYRRMYGDHFNPNTYAVIEQHADHFHWDAAKHWTDSREGVGEHGKRGGGHAHSGLLIYQGDNWPDSYRGQLFAINLHGRRLNQDALVRSGTGYKGVHADDIFFTKDPWFRAVELITGPDGAVYMADWSDVGECHENDGVHRNSGRIYKFSYGRPNRPSHSDLSLLPDTELIPLLSHKNDWYPRQVRRLLQERAHRKQLAPDTATRLQRLLKESRDPILQLRTLWSLWAIASLPESDLHDLLKQPNEHVRVWAVRFLLEKPVTKKTLERFVKLAEEEKSGLVRLYLASGLQKLPKEQVRSLAAALLRRGEDEKDHNQPHMIWYGIEGLAESHPLELAHLAVAPHFPQVRRWIARRLAQKLEQDPSGVNQLLTLAAAHKDREIIVDILDGMVDTLSGWKKAPEPQAWKTFDSATQTLRPERISLNKALLGLTFGHPESQQYAETILADSSGPENIRRDFLKALITTQAPKLNTLLEESIKNPALASLAAHGLASQNHPRTAALILDNWKSIRPEEQAEVISALVSRPALATALLGAIGENKIPRKALSPFHARQIASFRQPALTTLLTEKWGSLGETNAERNRQKERLKGVLTPSRLAQGNPGKGKSIFQANCSICHKLHGEGGQVGPDLTGAARSEVDYLVEHIVDPNSLVASDFRVSVVTLKDDRVLNGVLLGQNEKTVQLQGMNEVLRLERADIEKIEGSGLSLMPEGILDSLSEEEVRDLFAYLMK